CGWCKRMDASTFKDPVIVDIFNKNFYAVKLDAEMKDSIRFNGHIFFNPNPATRRSVHTLAASLLDNKMSYPSFVILNSEYSRLQTMAGFKDALALEPIVTYFGEGQHLEKSYEAWHKSFSPKVVKKVKPNN
ncbi:MAG: DUF255 domain-containing protein, partial [Bacteroidia bacterium]|nr:DUF255 domain-containing protein [Bacteroidia bacterium]